MKRFIPRLIGVLLGITVVFWGTYFALSFFETSSSQATLSEVVATVNGVAITREMVEAELKVSRLNLVEPLPPLEGDDLRRAAREALNQLTSRQIILQAAAKQQFQLDEAYIQTQANILFAPPDNETLQQNLAVVQATYADVLWWVGEIITVEEFTAQVIMNEVAPADRQQVYNDWLNEQQAQAKIVSYLDQASPNLTALVGQPAPNFLCGILSRRFLFGVVARNGVD